MFGCDILKDQEEQKNYLQSSEFTFFFQENFEFDIKGSDVMVFLHMQKTGGTAFGKHLGKTISILTKKDF